MSDTPTDAFVWRDAAPDTATFIAMRAACGWGTLSEQTARRALRSGTYNVTVFERDQIIAFGRVVGDGALYFYLQDIVVAPERRNCGLGNQIVRHLLHRIKEDAAPGGMVGLMSAVGKEAFYAKHGFTARPATGLGAGMTLFL